MIFELRQTNFRRRKVFLGSFRIIRIYLFILLYCFEFRLANPGFFSFAPLILGTYRIPVIHLSWKIGTQLINN